MLCQCARVASGVLHIELMTTVEQSHPYLNL